MKPLRSAARVRLFLAVACGVLLASGCAHYQSKPLSAIESATAYEARGLDDPGLRDFIQQTVAGGATNWPPAAWNFETLTLVALYYHPGLEWARAQWGVASAGIKPREVALILF